jgi:outer membrane receptor protein involved in Fe transport
VAGFRTRISGYQFYSFNGSIFVSGSLPLQSKGVEVDAVLRPLPGLSLNAGLMYDAVKRRDVFQRMNRAPKWSGSFTANYDHEVGESFVLNGSATFSFRSKIYIGTPLIIPVSPNTQRLDLRLAGGPSDKRWEAGVLVRNVFDVLSTDYGLANAAAPGTASVMPDLPRTVALQMSVKF